VEKRTIGKVAPQTNVPVLTGQQQKSAPVKTSQPGKTTSAIGASNIGASRKPVAAVGDLDEDSDEDDDEDKDEEDDSGDDDDDDDDDDDSLEDDDDDDDDD